MLRYELKKIFHFYIHSSIHIALVALALAKVYQILYHIPSEKDEMLFVFLSTFSGYNFVKYFPIVFRNRRLNTFSSAFKLTVVLTILSFLVSFFIFLQFAFSQQLIVLFISMIVYLYTFPLKKGEKNWRNSSGVKIYLVALCWTMLLGVLPFFSVFETHTLLFVQMFVFLLILLLIFEIKDLIKDDKSLKTIPQTIGIFSTKILIVLLCMFFLAIDFFMPYPFYSYHIASVCIIGLIVFFTYFVSPYRGKYYTLFWVESVPIFWLILLSFLS